MPTTPSMTTFEFGQVVLVRFPFTDQVRSKQRPAAVIWRAGELAALDAFPRCRQQPTVPLP